MADRFSDGRLSDVEEKILRAERLSFADGVHLFREANPLLLELGALRLELRHELTHLALALAFERASPVHDASR